MRFARAFVFGLILALGTLPAGAQTGAKKKSPDAKPPVRDAKAPADNNKPPAPDAEPPLRLPMNPMQAPYYATIDAIEKDGRVEISPPGPFAGSSPALTEGYYVGLVIAPGGTFEGARLIRVEVIDVKDADIAILQVGRSAAEALNLGEVLLLFRPAGITTARMKALPDLAPLAVGPAPGEKKDEGETVKLNQSFNNLKQIGLAIHNYHDVFAHCPPAAIFGPDGKPWHSWRVLILPFVDQAPLYNQYKFDEPWDGPNNRKLLDKIPPVFSDPIHGENKDFCTHYVAITGDDMAFTAEGADFDGKNTGPAMSGGRGFAQFTDGTSNTLLVGPVALERKIPWMKPVDVVVDDKFPDLGKKGGFPTPYKTGLGNAAPFLFSDGAVRGLIDTIDSKTFRALLTLDCGEVVGDYPFVNAAPMGGRMMLSVVYIIKEGKETTARLAQEPMPGQPPGMPGMPMGMGMPGMMPPPGPPFGAPALPAPGPAPAPPKAVRPAAPPGAPPLPAPAPAPLVKKRIQNP